MRVESKSVMARGAEGGLAARRGRERLGAPRRRFGVARRPFVGHGKPTPTDDRPLALVVDDSITVRRVTERFLQRSGLRVATAKDGLDAISVMRDHKPDVILLDIEMPRMDGYEFASHVRNDPSVADVPIIMVTSRVGDKHRARAIEQWHHLKGVLEELGLRVRVAHGRGIPGGRVLGSKPASLSRCAWATVQ